jgi:hypothetical protein
MVREGRERALIRQSGDLPTTGMLTRAGCPEERIVMMCQALALIGTFVPFDVETGRSPSNGAGNDV